MRMPKWGASCRSSTLRMSVYPEKVEAVGYKALYDAENIKPHS